MAKKNVNASETRVEAPQITVPILTPDSAKSETAIDVAKISAETAVTVSKISAGTAQRVAIVSIIVAVISLIGVVASAYINKADKAVKSPEMTHEEQASLAEQSKSLLKKFNTSKADVISSLEEKQEQIKKLAILVSKAEIPDKDKDQAVSLVTDFGAITAETKAKIEAKEDEIVQAYRKGDISTLR